MLNLCFPNHQRPTAKLTLFASCIVVLSVASAEAFSCLDGSAECTCDSGGSDTVTFWIETGSSPEPFRVTMPKNLLDNSFRPSPNSIQDGALLDVDIRDFSQWNGTPKKLEQKQFKLGILVSDFIELEEIVEYLTRSQANLASDDKVSFPVVTTEYGLERSDHPRVAGSWRDTEVFFFRPKTRANEDGNISDLITCKSPGSVPFPSCSQKISTPLADIKVTYRREYLKDWRIISDKTRKFWSCVTSVEKEE